VDLDGEIEYARIDNDRDVVLIGNGEAPPRPSALRSCPGQLARSPSFARSYTRPGHQIDTTAYAQIRSAYVPELDGFRELLWSRNALKEAAAVRLTKG